MSLKKTILIILNYKNPIIFLLSKMQKRRKVKIKKITDEIDKIQIMLVN